MIEPIHLSWSYYWPFALVVAWAIFDILRHHKKSELQLRLAGYAAGVIISVSVLVGVEFPPLVEGIQRNVKQHWFLGLLAAVIASSIAANRFWVLRQHARVSGSLWNLAWSAFRRWSSRTGGARANKEWHQRSAVPLSYLLRGMDTRLGPEAYYCLPSKNAGWYGFSPRTIGRAASTPKRVDTSHSQRRSDRGLSQRWVRPSSRLHSGGNPKIHPGRKNPRPWLPSHRARSTLGTSFQPTVAATARMCFSMDARVTREESQPRKRALTVIATAHFDL